MRRASFIAWFKVFGVVLALNVLFVFPLYGALGFLNEDTALIEGAVSGIRHDGLWSLFWTAYGPRVIRPFQLIDLAVAWNIGGMQPFVFHWMALILVALGQTFLFLALRSVIGFSGAAFAASLCAFSMAAAEPRFWISDRHDLYLLFFLALALLLTRKFFERLDNSWRRNLSFAVILSLVFWGGFYSNEKATAIPALICALATAYLLIRKSAATKREDLSRFGILVLIALANTAAYFAFRRSVLGEFIGGYNSSFLPAQGISFGLFWDWTLTILSAIFRQESAQLTIFAILVSVPAVAIALIACLRAASHSHSTSRVVSCAIACLGALYLSAIPTLQFSLHPPAIGPMNSRMLWLPTIVASVLLGALLGAALKSFQKPEGRGAVLYGFGLILVVSIYGGRQALVDYGRAAEYTRQIIRGYGNYCTCYDKSENQFEGLTAFPFGVNAFSEDAWIFTQASTAGMHECKGESESERNCKFLILSTEEGGETAPIRISASLQEKNWGDVPRDIFSKAGYSFQNMRSSIKGFPTASEILRGGTFVISGWAREQKSARPVDLVALVVDDQVLLATPPNVVRDARVAAKRMESSVNEMYGFSIALDTRSLPADARVVKLCVAGKSAALQGKWAAKCLAAAALPGK